MRHKNNLKNLIVIFVAGLIVGAGAFYGGENLGWFPSLEKAVILPPNATSTILTADMGLFWDSVSLIKEKHFRISEVSDEDLERLAKAHSLAV